MRHHKLNHPDEARSALTKLRELMQVDKFKNDEEAPPSSSKPSD